MATTILLLCPIHEGGYHANLERMRSVHAGAEARHPLLSFSRLIGCTPDEGPGVSMPDAGRMMDCLRQRVTGPAPPCEAWVFGRGAGIAEQAAVCVAAGLPVRLFGQEEADELRIDGEIAMALAAAPPEEDDRPVFSGPKAVLMVLYHGAESALGARALDYGRVGVGAHYNAMDRLLTMSVRLFMAAAVVRAATNDQKWDNRMPALLEAHYRQGMPLLRAAIESGAVPADAGRDAAVEQMARRLRNRALGCIERALAARIERAREKQDAAQG